MIEDHPPDPAEELRADRRRERLLVVWAVLALLAVAAIAVARQLWWLGG